MRKEKGDFFTARARGPKWLDWVCECPESMVIGVEVPSFEIQLLWSRNICICFEIAATGSLISSLFQNTLHIDASPAVP